MSNNTRDRNDDYVYIDGLYGVWGFGIVVDVPYDYDCDTIYDSGCSCCVDARVGVQD